MTATGGTLPAWADVHATAARPHQDADHRRCHRHRDPATGMWLHTWSIPGCDCHHHRSSAEARTAYLMRGTA